MRCTVLRPRLWCVGLAVALAPFWGGCSNPKPADVARVPELSVPESGSPLPSPESQPEKARSNRDPKADRAEEIRREVAAMDARMEHLAREVHRKGLTPPYDFHEVVSLTEAAKTLEVLEGDPAKAEEAAVFRVGFEKQRAHFDERYAELKRQDEERKPYNDEMLRLAQERFILEHELKGLVRERAAE